MLIPGTLAIVVSLQADPAAAANPVPTVPNAPVAQGASLASNASPTSPAHAPPEPSFREHAEAARSLEVMLTPYLWLTGLSGTVKVAGVDTHINENFAQIIGHSDGAFGFMGALDIVSERLVLQLNGACTTVRFSRQRATFGAGTIDASLRSNAAWVEFFAGYRVADTPMTDDPRSSQRLTLDGFVGGRVTFMKVDTSFRVGVNSTLPNGQLASAGIAINLDTSEQWVEPFIGLRLGADLPHGWKMSLRGDIGGFGVDGSRLSWQAVAALGYQWDLENWSISVFLGYRALKQDYSNGYFGWDAITHGPMLGAQITF